MFSNRRTVLQSCFFDYGNIEVRLKLNVRMIIVPLTFFLPPLSSNLLSTDYVERHYDEGGQLSQNMVRRSYGSSLKFWGIRLFHLIAKS